MDLFVIGLEIFLFALILIEHRKIKELNQAIDLMTYYDDFSIPMAVAKVSEDISNEIRNTLRELRMEDDLK